MADNVIDEATLKKVEAEVAKKQAEELAKLSEEKAKEVEAKVRREMQDAHDKEVLQKKLEEQSSQLKAMQDAQLKIQQDFEAKAKADKEAFEKRLIELEAVRKGVVQNVSPFQDNKDNPNFYKGVDLSKIDEKAVEEESRLAWMKKVGIQDDSWGKPL